MSTAPPRVGHIAWADLTVDDADGVRAFYEDVVGWTSQPVSMEGYDDFSMLPGGATEAVAGVCHARGVNAQLPPVWLLYVVVDRLEDRLETCRRLGGEVLVGPAGSGEGRIAVIRDPAGAALALYEAA